MKPLRVLLMFGALLLLILDFRAVEFVLHGPDVLHVIDEGDGIRILPYRWTAADYGGFATLIVAHGIVVFGLLRTRPRARTGR
jgi:hypothetical protein